MPRIHNNTLVFGTPDATPSVKSVDLGAPYPHSFPFRYIDEYEARLGRHRRQQVLDAVVDGMSGLRGKLVELGPRTARAARPSFPIAGVPAALRAN